MRRAFLALLFLTTAAGAFDEDLKIQRKLGKLYLGDNLREIQRIYKPAQEWPSTLEPRGQVHRLRVERAYLKKPDLKIETMYLGMRSGRLVEIQYIYDAAASRAKSAHALAADWAIIYGEPRLTDGRYWWDDGQTVLRVFSAEVPVLDGQGTAVELRTSVQIMDAGLFERVD